ncbi:DUF5819 family protein [Kitasatospora sp. NPDC094015]|uniref:DUF5819 family protein n=1 Tax=Kitasatospora sp. NPDC094015 TaxID=3155205 RepID=UPI00331FA787
MRVWSTPALLVICLSGAALLGGTGLFLAALFLHVAPVNAVSTAYRGDVDRVVYPEFEQNWKLFAPNPLQQNVTVDAQVRTIGADGALTTREWVGLTAQDVAAIRGNPAPSHLDQNMLRRAVDFYTSTHPEQDGAVVGPRGALAQQYLERIALQRLGRTAGGERIVEIRFRLGTATIAPPAWSHEQPATDGPGEELPWWPVTEDDFRGLG